jgi:proteasome lid subunit RPN8/RPN11
MAAVHESTGAARVAVSKDASREPARLPAEVALDVYEHAVQCYPEECCGLLLGPPGAVAGRAVRCTNVQSRRQSRGESELSAREAFWIDEAELLAALKEADECGEALRGIYHSHVDGDAYLSHTDIEGALGSDGALLYPGVSQLVVAVWEDGVRDLACFDWDAAAGGFVGRGVMQVDA